MGSSLARQWQEALALLVECRGRKLRLDLVIFNSVISACEKGGHWQGALQLLEDLEEASLEKSLVSYNAAISASEKAGYWQLALGLVAELRRRRLQENLITCCAAIAACTRGMEWSAALSLLSLQQRMKQEHHVAYVSAVNACVQSWQHQSAQRVLSELEMFLCGLAKTSARLGRRQIGNEWPLAQASPRRADELPCRVFAYSQMLYLRRAAQSRFVWLVSGVPQTESAGSGQCHVAFQCEERQAAVPVSSRLRIYKRGPIAGHET